MTGGGMMENHMEEVAAIFDKRLGECFKVNFGHAANMARFTPRGMEYKNLHKDDDTWHDTSYLLVALLTGEAVVADEH